MYAYADGGAHVLLTGAFDALAGAARPRREPATALAYPGDADRRLRGARPRRPNAPAPPTDARRAAAARPGAAEGCSRAGACTGPAYAERGAAWRRADRAAGTELRDRQAPAALARPARRRGGPAGVVQRRARDLDALGDEEPRARRGVRGRAALRHRDLRAGDDARADGGAARARPAAPSRAARAAPESSCSAKAPPTAACGRPRTSRARRSASRRSPGCPRRSSGALTGPPAALRTGRLDDTPRAQRQHRRGAHPLLAVIGAAVLLWNHPERVREKLTRGTVSV